VLFLWRLFECSSLSLSLSLSICHIGLQMEKAKMLSAKNFGDIDESIKGANVAYVWQLIS
jgi:hypothetical protein